MDVQVAILLLVAVLLLQPWQLATRRRCQLCHSSTPRRLSRCRSCGATQVFPAEQGAESTTI